MEARGDRVSTIRVSGWAEVYAKVTWSHLLTQAVLTPCRWTIAFVPTAAAPTYYFDR